ncbi:MAG: nuclear transport factor 2 family protein [Solirubrobacterales bacterium]|nr:nuclear transport factor 2 family protein [Solirubrobacterales bacterium]
MVHDELLQIEEELGRGGDGDAYRRHLAEDAVVVVPGAVLDREACAAAIDASAPWDEHEIADARTRMLGDDAAVLTYRWRSRRGEQAYAATMSSAYARRDGAWRLVLHQQTPEPGA